MISTTKHKKLRTKIRKNKHIRNKSTITTFPTTSAVNLATLLLRAIVLGLIIVIFILSKFFPDILDWVKPFMSLTG